MLYVNASVEHTQSRASALPDPPPLAWTNKPSPLPFNNFKAVIYHFHPLTSDLPSLQSIVDEPEASTEVADTSYLFSQMEAELHAAVHSIITSPSPAPRIFPVTEDDSKPETNSVLKRTQPLGPAPVLTPLPEPIVVPILPHILLPTLMTLMATS